MEGFLSKKGVSRRNWKKRYFTLVGTELRYYAQRPGSDQDAAAACKGRIELRGRPLARACTSAKVLQKHKHAFEIPAADIYHAGYTLEALEQEQQDEMRLPPPQASLEARGSFDADAESGAAAHAHAHAHVSSSSPERVWRRQAEAAVRRTARVYLLSADSELERDAWLRALQSAVTSVRSARSVSAASVASAASEGDGLALRAIGSAAASAPAWSSPHHAYEQALRTHRRLMQLLQSSADAAALVAAAALAAEGSAVNGQARDGRVDSDALVAGVDAVVGAGAQSAMGGMRAGEARKHEALSADVGAWHVALRLAWQMRPILLFDAMEVVKTQVR